MKTNKKTSTPSSTLIVPPKTPVPPTWEEWQKQIESVAAKDPKIVALEVTTQITSAKASSTTALTAAKAVIYSVWAVGTLVEKMKARLAYGDFEIWVTKSCKLSMPTAWRYRRFANRSHVNDLAGYSSLRQAMIAAGAIKSQVPREVSAPKALGKKITQAGAARLARSAPVQKLTKEAANPAKKASSTHVAATPTTGLLPGMEETPDLATLADDLISAINEAIKHRPLKSWPEAELKRVAKKIEPVVAFYKMIHKTRIFDKVFEAQSHTPPPANCRVDINSVFANSQISPTSASSPAPLPKRALVS